MLHIQSIYHAMHIQLVMLSVALLMALFLLDSRDTSAQSFHGYFAGTLKVYDWPSAIKFFLH